MITVLVPLAVGFEEIEAITVVDLLRRAEIRTLMAGLIPGPVTGRSGIAVVPDCLLSDVVDQRFDLIVLPGGAAGAEQLGADPRVRRMVREAHQRATPIAAICAAPAVFADLGLLDGVAATSHPSVRARMGGARYSEDRVVTEGSIITSRGPGTALEFALELVRRLAGPDVAARVSAGILAR